jgi:hypothetical protein
MRYLLLMTAFFWIPLSVAEPASPASLQPVFELAGINLLCQQTEPLLKRGLSAAQQARLGQHFSAATLCQDLAQRVASQLDEQQVQQAQAMLEDERALRFMTLERAVGEEAPDALSAYRKQLAERPPRGERLALVQQLDQASHTTDLAYLLRYEVGKTQALLVLKGRGQSLSEAELSRQTASQGQALRLSSAEGVASFMLYAYRHVPSAELEAYRQMYQQEPLASVLRLSVAALESTFAARRAQLK